MLVLDLPRCPYNYSSSFKYHPSTRISKGHDCYMLNSSLLNVAVVSKLCCHHYPPVSPWLVSVVPLLRPPPAVMAPLPASLGMESVSPLIECNAALLAPIHSSASRESVVNCRFVFYFIYVSIFTDLEYTNSETSSLMVFIFY